MSDPLDDLIEEAKLHIAAASAGDEWKRGAYAAIEWFEGQLPSLRAEPEARGLASPVEAGEPEGHYHGLHFHEGPCVGGVRGDKYPLTPVEAGEPEP